MEATMNLFELCPAWVEHAAAYVTVAMTILTALGKALNAAVPRLRAIAATTPNESDDRFVATLAEALAWINALLPHTILGTNVDEARPLGKRPPSSGLSLVLVLVLASTASACGGTQIDKTRKAFEGVAIGALAVDEVVRPYFVAARNRCLDELAAMETPTRDAFDECMARWNAGEAALAQLGFALLAGEDVLDAIEAKKEGDICDAIRPIGEALSVVYSALVELELPIPDDIGVAIPVIAELAESYCGMKRGG